MRVLVVDVGGSNVKALATGAAQQQRFPSGPQMSPDAMVAGVLELAQSWSYDAISIGYPGVVVQGRIAVEPHNLGAGWVDYDFATAFSRPVRVINDAAMQALGAYRRGRMLFLGFGTGLGSAMVHEGRVLGMELGHLPYRKGLSYEEYAGAAGRERLGKKRWRKHSLAIIALLRAALLPDEVVVGGGNGKALGELPQGVRLGRNADAFTGGFRLWDDGADEAVPLPEPPGP